MGGLPTQQPAVAFAAEPSQNPVMYAGLPDGVWKSADAGKSWRRLTTRAGVSALAVHPGKPELVFAGTDQGEILRSSDGGSSWQAPR